MRPAGYALLGAVVLSAFALAALGSAAGTVDFSRVPRDMHARDMAPLASRLQPLAAR